VILDVERAISCGLVVNELATNALTHAFPNGNGGEINIILSLLNTKHLRLIVSDNGIGLPADWSLASSSSMGMMVVQSLTRQLGATVDITSEKGTTFTIDFPA
jgi:two-component sensor histidine kinase